MIRYQLYSWKIQKQLYACMIVYTIMGIIMRDGMQKNYGSSALARRDMSEIQVNIYLSPLEVFNCLESYVGGKSCAGLRDLGGL